MLLWATFVLFKSLSYLIFVRLLFYSNGNNGAFVFLAVNLKLNLFAIKKL